MKELSPFHLSFLSEQQKRRNQPKEPKKLKALAEADFLVDFWSEELNRAKTGEVSLFESPRKKKKKKYWVPFQNEN